MDLDVSDTEIVDDSPHRELLTHTYVSDHPPAPYSIIDEVLTPEIPANPSASSDGDPEQIENSAEIVIPAVNNVRVCACVRAYGGECVCLTAYEKCNLICYYNRI